MEIARQRQFQWLVQNWEIDRILLVIGPRQVGKTTLLKQFQEYLIDRDESTFFINLENSSYKDLLNKDPENIFQLVSQPLPGKHITVFIDEIQYLRNPSNVLKWLYDEYKGRIKLIVSGSSAFYIDQKFTDSLAGRKFIYEMYPLNFSEYLDFRGRPQPTAVTEATIDKYLPDYYDYITYGGYPEVVLAETPEQKKTILAELVNAYTKKDIIDYQLRSADNYVRFMKILSSQIGSLVNLSEISNTLDVPRSTLEQYLYVMHKSFHVSLVRPFHQNIRKELSKMPKVYFFDTGLRNFLLGNFEPFALRIDRGGLLENVFYRQLLNSVSHHDIRYWRTQNGNEVDFVVQEKMAYEIKQDIKKFIRKKYKLFTSAYPDITLEPMDLRGCLRGEIG